MLKDGRIDQVELNLAGATPSGKVVRSMKLGTQSEGCVVDDRTGLLYVAEEDVGLWRFDVRPDGSNTSEKLGRADGKQLVILLADGEARLYSVSDRDFISAGCTKLRTMTTVPGCS